MSKPPFPRVAELFDEAVRLPIDQRAAFLEAACAGDSDLRAAVEQLLLQDADDTDIFEESPVADLRPDQPTRPPVLGTAALPSLLPQIPGYELLRTLGRGGMGVVFLARHLALNRLVALKMLALSPISAEQLARFRRETDALARLAHPNIVPIHDVGEFEGHPFFTMEHVAGPSLAERLDGRPQDPLESARLVEVLAEAVEAVHRCGIIHRDLKPANVLLTADGTPKITDFGLAKDQSITGRLTPSGTAMGTPSYMAPEQVQGHSNAVGPAADIYSLGAILYEMLTGRPPFDAETPLGVMAQVVHDEPLSPSRLRPRLPADLVTICLKCLEKSPRRRYASALNLAEDLRRFRSGEPIQTRPVGPLGRAYRWCLRRPLVAGLLALTTALAIAFVTTVIVYEILLADALERTQTEARDERQQIVELNLTLGAVALEDRDGFLAVLYFSEALRLDEGNGASEPIDRTRIAAALRQCPRLVQVAVHDGPIIGVHLDPSAGWGVTVGSGNELEVWNAQTGQTIGEAVKLDQTPRAAAVSSDGRLLATVNSTGRTQIWDMTTGKSVVLPIRETETVRHVAFPPRGRILLTVLDDSSVQVWSLNGDQPVRMWSLSSQSVKSSALSDDGHWLFQMSPAGEGQLWDTATGKVVASLKVQQAIARTAVSPDGRRLALVAADGTLRTWDVAIGEWLSDPIRLGPDIRHVEFSPDGGALVAASESAARVWDAKSGQRLTPPLRAGGPIAAAAFSADGRQVITITQHGTVCVWELPRPGEPADDARAEQRPIAEIVGMARMLACARIDGSQHRHGLDEEAFRAAWKKLHAEGDHP